MRVDQRHDRNILHNALIDLSPQLQSLRLIHSASGLSDELVHFRVVVVGFVHIAVANLGGVEEWGNVSVRAREIRLPGADSQVEVASVPHRIGVDGAIQRLDCHRDASALQSRLNCGSLLRLGRGGHQSEVQLRVASLSKQSLRLLHIARLTWLVQVILLAAGNTRSDESAGVTTGDLATSCSAVSLTVCCVENGLSNALILQSLIVNSEIFQRAIARSSQQSLLSRVSLGLSKLSRRNKIT